MVKVGPPSEKNFQDPRMTVGVDDKAIPKDTKSVNALLQTDALYRMHAELHEHEKYIVQKLFFTVHWSVNFQGRQRANMNSVRN